MISGLLHHEGQPEMDILNFRGRLIELRICRQQLGDLAGQRRSVNQLVVGNSGQWAAGYVAHHVSAGSLGEDRSQFSVSTISGSDSIVSQ